MVCECFYTIDLHWALLLILGVQRNNNDYVFILIEYNLHPTVFIIVHFPLTENLLIARNVISSYC